jgi:hypothetical protein
MFVDRFTGGNMRALATGIMLAALLCAPALAGEGTDGSITWAGSFDDAAALAKQTGQHLVVQFFTPT